MEPLLGAAEPDKNNTGAARIDALYRQRILFCGQLPKLGDSMPADYLIQ